ncbi:hypothetical protein LTR09_005346 [Extremus antarcticus]|uniref:Uncharacterized protein n=1 Tax=Extremus antarcticus TaxID=702011 RepID=A0AAJ0DGP9_9PEZI|nr:hypothetical protein LTR09_005346 [Extremus antarcticus]
MDHSPLRKLPAEIRNEISSLALAAEDTIMVKQIPSGHRSKSYEDAAYRGVHLKGHGRRLRALSDTCRELRNDTTHMFFSVNSFAPYLPAPHLDYVADRSDPPPVGAKAFLTPLNEFLTLLQKSGVNYIHSVLVIFPTSESELSEDHDILLEQVEWAISMAQGRMSGNMMFGFEFREVLNARAIDDVTLERPPTILAVDIDNPRLLARCQESLEATCLLIEAPCLDCHCCAPGSEEVTQVLERWVEILVERESVGDSAGGEAPNRDAPFDEAADDE